MQSYLAGTGRLDLDVTGAHVRAYTYDASGNTSRTYRAGGGGPAYDQASYYDATGRLVAAANRWDSTTAIGNVLFTTEEYRHDALGRRAWVRRHRNCAGVGGSYYQPQHCGLSVIRRTVWDGAQELAEVQVPGDSTTSAGNPWPFFSIVPHGNRRGQAAMGTHGTGQWGLQFAAGGSQCAASARA